LVERASGDEMSFVLCNYCLRRVRRCVDTRPLDSIAGDLLATFSSSTAHAYGQDQESDHRKSAAAS